MGSALIVGAGIVIASAVGPANEWRLAFHVRSDSGIVDRSQVLRSEAGVPGSVVWRPEPDVVRVRVPLSEQLIKKPVPPAPAGTKVRPLLVNPPRPPAERRPAPPIPIVVITPPKEPDHDMAIPTNTSPVPPSTTQQTGELGIRTDGPTESATPQRVEVETTKGADGWNKVTTTKTGFVTSNPERAAAIDKQRAEKEAPFIDKPHAAVYVNIDPRDPDSSMTPMKTTSTVDVHDSQLHLFETAAQTQGRMSTAIQDMANGDASAMQSLFHDIANGEAAANKTRLSVVHSTQRYRFYGNRGVSSGPGPIDPRLMEDDKQRAEAAELSKFVGVERYVELRARDQATVASEYFNQYVRENKQDGRAQAVYGLQQLAAKKYEIGLSHLAQACKFSATAWATPLNLKELGISEAAVADSLGKLMGQKEQAKGVDQAIGMAAASFAVGRPEAAKRLLDVAISQGMDAAEVANLAGLWKIRK